MRNGVRTFRASGWGVFVAVLLGASGLAAAADLPPSNAPTLDDYCASTGGCFKSLQEAEQAIEDAVPVYRGLMRQDKIEPVAPGSESLRFNYRVDNRAPSVLYPPTYRIAGLQNSTPMCPGLEATGDRYFPLLCLADAPMIAQYKATYLVNTEQCTYTNIRTEGDYSPTPTWHVANTPGTSGYVDYVPPNKTLEWDIYCTGWGNVPPDHRSVELAKFQSYICPEGFQGVNSLTPVMDRVCGPNRSIPYITLRKITQTPSCAANKYPCHPDNGDKSRVEPDFEFAGRTFNRYYHSLRQVFLPQQFPVGWSFTYSSRLQLPHKYLISDEGYYAKLTQISTDVYAVGKSSGTTLTRVSDSLYVLRDAYGEVRSFDSDGRLVAVQDLTNPANDVFISYQPVDDVPQLSRIANIRDAGGRTVNFVYKDGRLKWIELPDGNLVIYKQNELGALLSVDYGAGQVKQYHWGEAGLTPTLGPFLLTGITGEDGVRYASFGYDRWGRVISSELHADGGRVEGTFLSYQDAQHVSVKTASGEIRHYTFAGDFYRSPLSVTDSRGVELSSYDSQGRLLQRTDRKGNITQLGYTGPYLTATTEAKEKPEQRTIQVDWDSALSAPFEQRTLDAAGVIVGKLRWNYNARGQRTQLAQVDPGSDAARTSTITYCEAADVSAGTCPLVGLVTAIDGPRTDIADATTFQYYPANAPLCPQIPGNCTYRKGDLWKITNATGQVTEVLSYDALGRVLSVRDLNGVVTDTEYNYRGWITARKVRGANGGTEADDEIVRVAYWPTGQVQEVTEPDGSTVTYIYDAAQRLTDIADNAGNTIHYTLDNAGNRLKEDTVDTGGTLRRTLARIYNTLGQLTTLEDAGNHATGFAYDPEGNPASVTDALQRVTTQQHDPLNRLARTLQDVGGIEAEITSSYNALDQVTQVTDPKGLHTSYAYNGFGDLTGQASPNSGGTGFTVDSAGNRKTRTDARGVTATYYYDALNRLTGIAYPDPNLGVGYTYDTAPAACEVSERFAKGRLGQVLHAGGSTGYCYDRFGRVTRKVQTVNGVSSTLRYGYTKGGRLAQLTYPDGSVADYVRDSLGRISQIGLTRPGQARQLVVTNVSHAPFGPATGWTYGNGRQLLRPVDTDYRPHAVHDTAVDGLSLGFGYDPVGSITELKNGTGSAVQARYGYDTLGRLTQTQDGPTSTPIETYAYDATGNRISLTTANGTASYTYPADSHRLLAVDGEARNHDAAGNTISIGGKEYLYNDANRMSQVKQAGAVLEAYTYNHRGERVMRAPTAGDAQVTLYDEAGQWLGNYAATGAPLQQAIWLDNYPVALLNTAATGVPELAYIQPDHLGTPRMVIDPVRDVAIWEWSNKSEVFGNQIPSSDPDGDGVAFDLALRFPGQQATDASGMFYNYQRDYDPEVGQYSQSDPIGLEGGISTYAYVSGNPILLIDPEGLRQSFADCVGENRWDWGKLGPAGKGGASALGNVASSAQVANAAGNAAVGYTGSGMSRASHATSWQHAAGSEIGQAGQRAFNGRSFGPQVQVPWSNAGKFLGRLAIAPTIWEGFYDVGTIVYCGCSAATGD
jgi:RHS repeat-associated protein